MSPFPDDDIGHVLHDVGEAWEKLRGGNLLITGGTGFFGRWLLESLLAADRQYGLGVRVTVLSRDPGAFVRSNPHLASWSGLSWERGSVVTLSPDSMRGRRFGLVAHLATEADLKATVANPAAATAVIVDGTRRTLELAARTGARRFLFTSSGSVYSVQPPDVGLLTENHALGSFDMDRPDAKAIGAEAKRQAERLCVEAAGRWGINPVIARCFTFAGPGQPLDGKFAFGNFMRDARSGRRIVLTGDGTPIRSYLYASDLAAWLWTLLAFGIAGRVYNVGSEEPISMRDLAYMIASELGAQGVEIAGKPEPGRPPHRYVPSTLRARSELGLRQAVNLPEAIRKTAEWLRH